MEKYCVKCFKKYSGQLDKCPQDGTVLVRFDEQDLTGKVLDDRYTILEVIGKGGMGEVYKAQQHLIGRIVALKVIRREVFRNEMAVKRFLTEARAIASLENPHTVTLYDFGVSSDGLLYYTMEFLDGKPLSKIINEEAPLHYRRAAAIILQCCESLHEAHAKGILHRDIKPDNLFVLKREGREHVKVVDFGVAKLMDDTSIGSVTKTGMVCGTPDYLSPEQAKGDPAVPASDLYSLAIVFYEMLAGVPPFKAGTPMKILYKQINEEAQPVCVKNPKVQIPRSIDKFLRTALTKEIAKRFSCVSDFRSALLHALETQDRKPETISITPMSTSRTGLRWVGETPPGSSTAHSSIYEQPQRLRAEPQRTDNSTQAPGTSYYSQQQQAEENSLTESIERQTVAFGALEDTVVAQTPGSEAILPLPNGDEDKKLPVGQTNEKPSIKPSQPQSSVQITAVGKLFGNRVRKIVLLGAASAVVVGLTVLGLWQPWTGKATKQKLAQKNEQIPPHSNTPRSVIPEIEEKTSTRQGIDDNTSIDNGKGPSRPHSAQMSERGGQKQHESTYHASGRKNKKMKTDTGLERPRNKDRLESDGLDRTVVPPDSQSKAQPPKQGTTYKQMPRPAEMPKIGGVGLAAQEGEGNMKTASAGPQKKASTKKQAQSTDRNAEPAKQKTTLIPDRKEDSTHTKKRKSGNKARQVRTKKSIVTKDSRRSTTKKQSETTKKVKRKKTAVPFRIIPSAREEKKDTKASDSTQSHKKKLTGKEEQQKSKQRIKFRPIPVPGADK